MSRDKLLMYIDHLWQDVWQATKYIFDNPELGEQEFKAVGVLRAILARHGFAVTSPYLGVNTSFKAVLGQGKPVVYLVAEYDALPEIGHGCGHHLIAGASLAAALALGGLKDIWSGTLAVLGTPAEETKGGKIELAEKGAFKEADAVLMFHPGQSNIINITSNALEALEVTFIGKAGHGTRGEEGNPLVSLVKLYQDTLMYNKIYYAQQQIEGVITSGGATPNLIPEKAVGKFYLRAGTLQELKQVIKEFKSMVGKAGEYNRTEGMMKSFESRYLPMKTNKELARIFIDEAQKSGNKMDMNEYQIIGAMDLGNVSREVPAIHPYLRVGKGYTAAHTKEFTKIAGSSEGEKTMKAASRALAVTALKLFTEPGLVQAAWEEHLK
ncbi:MAG: amidohydrolase [Peptococcaceae bacterium]